MEESKAAVAAKLLSEVFTQAAPPRSGLSGLTVMETIAELMKRRQPNIWLDWCFAMMARRYFAAISAPGESVTGWTEVNEKGSWNAFVPSLRTDDALRLTLMLFPNSTIGVTRSKDHVVSMLQLENGRSFKADGYTCPSMAVLDALFQALNYIRSDAR